jgi:K+-transporting ATPase ATPase C chain
MKLKTLLIESLKIYLLAVIGCGGLYTLFIFGFAQALFPAKAEGSLLYAGNKPVGSELIGQKFNSEKYFHSRPSAIDYNPMPSGASNLGWSSMDLVKQYGLRKTEFLTSNQVEQTIAIPAEMLFTSGSGVDPHISTRSAQLQVARIVKARNLPESANLQISKLIDELSEFSVFNLSGGTFVNVNLLNIRLDNLR